MPGHGNHWECLYDDVEEFVDRILPELVLGLKPSARVAMTDPLTTEDGDVFDTVMTFMEPEGDIRHMMLAVADSLGESVELYSAYPFLTSGHVYEIEINAIHEWENGLEAQIEGTTPVGSNISFYDPLYSLNKANYEIGARLPFALSALAYRAEELRNDKIELPKTEANREMWQDRPNPDEPVTLSLKGASIYLPAGSPEPDDFQFQAPIKSIEELEFADQIVYRITAPLAKVEETGLELVLPVYVPEQTAPDGFTPEKGMDLTGIIWVQGFLAEEGELGLFGTPDSEIIH